MLRIKKQTLLSFGLISMLLLQGCSLAQSGDGNENSSGIFSFGSKKTVSSTEGNDEKSKVNVADYLDKEILNQTVSSEESYTTYTVTRGDFVTTYDMDQGEIYPYNATTITIECEQGTIYFKEYCVSLYQYVEKGDPIAKVYVELDTTQLNELKLNLERYEKRYQEAKDAQKEQDEDYKERFTKNMTAVERMKLQQEYDNFLFSWEQSCDNWEKLIEDTKKQIEDIEEAASTTEIISTGEGYIVNLQRYIKEGDELSNGYVLAAVTDASPVYIKVDGNGLYSYGSKVQVTWKGNGSKYEGTVVTLDPKTASYDMFSTDAAIRVDCTFADIGQSLYAGLSIVTRDVKDVLLVDRAAVTEEDSIPYVTVKNEDGSLCKTGFVAGGYNQDYYWVYSGLSEGMQLVVKKN